MAWRLARLLAIVAGAAAGHLSAASLGLAPLGGLVAGAAAGGAAVALEAASRRVAMRPLLWTTAGAVAGLLAGLILGLTLSPLAGGAAPVLRTATGLLGAWLGGMVAARRASEDARAADRAGDQPRLLDTSVLIDGRIADVAEAGFLDGVVIVPRFVVRELQRLADAGDGLRRGRARRGFDVLDRLRRCPGVRLDLAETDFPGIAEVDARLVALARARGARLLTHDTALGRLATLDGVSVGNLNDLAAALRPVVLPGEPMQVLVQREGKEPGQGVGYLEDGTMVVVEGGKRFIGQSLDVVVTSALQTSAGRMIFARLRGEDARDA
jgi:uncharacterized protein YacL